MRATGQTWKFVVPIALATLSGAAIPFQFSIARMMGTDAVYISLLSVAICLPTFLLAFSWVRCPRCSLKVIWHAVSKKDHREWFKWLMTIERCPECGYEGEARSSIGSVK
jgi:DNA-directed RNA polymerase subunit RPC12/RpoP